MTDVSVKLTKKEQIEQRRTLILELRSQGMSQHKIVGVLKPDVLKISQKTVSRDIEYLDKHRLEYVKRNRQHMAEEYQSTYNNLKTLRRDIFEHYRAFKERDDIDGMIALVPIIEDIELSIHNIVASGYHIEAELIKYGQEQNKELEERMEQALAKTKHNIIV